MNDREHEEDFEVQTDTDATTGKMSAGGSPDDFRILEAVLFASDELLTPAHLKTILPGNPDARKIRSMVEKINVQLQKERHPFEIVEIGGGYQFRTITYYHPWVRQIFKEKAAKKLSIQALECLAIIAYKQPISKAEIELIRGVVSDGAMKTLLEKRLVTIAGRSEKPGRPLLYGTTQTFLKYFGLNKKEDLPRIEEFEAMAREKMEGLSIDDLEQEEIDMKVDAVDDGANSAAAQTAEPVPDASSLFEVELTGDISPAAPVMEDETVVDIERMSVEDTQPIRLPAKSADDKSDPEVSTDGGDTELEESTVDDSGEGVLEVEKPTIKIDAVESEPAAADEVDTEITAYDLEFELLKSSGRAKASDAFLPDREAGAAVQTPVAPEAAEVKSEVKKKSVARDVETNAAEDLSELETTIACLADIEKGEAAQPEVLEMDDEDIFDFEASFAKASGDERKETAAAMNKASPPIPGMKDEPVTEKSDDRLTKDSGEPAADAADWEPEAGIFEIDAVDSAEVGSGVSTGKGGVVDGEADIDQFEVKEPEPSGGTGRSEKTAGTSAKISRKRSGGSKRTTGSKKTGGGDRTKDAGGKSAGTGEKPAVRKDASKGKKESGVRSQETED